MQGSQVKPFVLPDWAGRGQRGSLSPAPAWLARWASTSLQTAPECVLVDRPVPLGLPAPACVPARPARPAPGRSIFVYHST